MLTLVDATDALLDSLRLSVCPHAPAAVRGLLDLVSHERFPEAAGYLRDLG